MGLEVAFVLVLLSVAIIVISLELVAVDVMALALLVTTRTVDPQVRGRWSHCTGGVLIGCTREKQ